MSADFDFDDDAPTRDHSRRRPPPPRQETGHGKSAFMTMFGGSLGCFAAIILIVVVGLVVSGLKKDPPPARRDVPASR